MLEPRSSNRSQRSGGHDPRSIACSMKAAAQSSKIQLLQNVQTDPLIIVNRLRIKKSSSLRSTVLVDFSFLRVMCYVLCFDPQPISISQKGTCSNCQAWACWSCQNQQKNVRMPEACNACHCNTLHKTFKSTFILAKK